MATPKHVSKKLREMLGSEAAESMVDWMDERDAQHAELRQETRADIAELRHEMRAGFAGVDAKLAQLWEEMRVGFAAMDTKMAQRNADLMKRALGFWMASLLGVVGAIAALTRVSR